jgi:hypothetical protein
LALFDDPGGIDVFSRILGLPGGNLAGFELAEKCERKDPTLKVVYKTAPELPETMKRLLAD